jgi:SAM-dependent MidA family methyltransferase
LNTAADEIRAEIARCGAISFARFMQLALYCPVCGFYEKENDTLGRRGNFYTSVSVGSLFGELLAFRFGEWLAQLRTLNNERGCNTLKIIEAGAHDGELARDILNWLRLRWPGLSRQIEYWIVEPSARRQQWQRKTLKEFLPQVRWLESLVTFHASRINGIILANELLDAMPVHRVGWDAGRREWFEWGVTLNDEQFVWTRLLQRDHASHFTPDVAPELLAVIRDGFTTEICPAAQAWWREAADALGAGKLLTIDYGLRAEEFFSPHRKDGTLRAYHRHHVGADILANPGEQDLTAHVNFTSIQSAGERAGLKTEVFDTQARFLTDIARHTWNEENGFGPWTPERTRQFQTLTHPEHLGRAFHVLVQAR